MSYDISDESTRRRIHDILKGYGKRVQYSVFECRLSGPEYRELKERVAPEIEGETDNVRFYNLCSFCEGKIEFVGNGKMPEDDLYFMV